MGRTFVERRLKVAELKAAARRHKEEHRVGAADRPGIAASALQLGAAYGVGVGLYVKSLAWLRLLFAWMALGAVPFLVLVTRSKFTSPELGARQLEKQRALLAAAAATWNTSRTREAKRPALGTSAAG